MARRSTPQVLLVGLTAVTLVALIVAASTSSVAFGTYNPAWDGATDLRALAGDEGADVTVARDGASYGATDADRTVAVVLSPADPYDRAEVAALRGFLDRGGTLVIADDFGAEANPLLAQLDARSRVTGTPLRDEREFHRAPSLPVATTVTPTPMTAGVEQLHLNHPSSVDPNGASVLVRTSGFAYEDANRNGALDDDERLDRHPVVTVESVGSGTLVVAGDPSLFINVMLEQPGNEAFVRNLVDGHDAVLLDYSHAGGLPPLSVALLVLRDTPALQVGLGVAGLGLIAAWARGWLGRPSWPSAGPAGPAVEPALTEAELVAYVSRRHPDWESDRVRRVVRGVMASRGEPAANE